MKTTKWHMSTNIEGLLRNMKGKKINLVSGGGLGVTFKFNEKIKGFEFSETKSNVN